MNRKTEIETAAYDYAKDIPLLNTARQGFVRGAEWADEHPAKHWKSADGDDLPDIDRDVIALTAEGKVVFAHRPPESWNGKNLKTGGVTTYYPKRYGAGGWNQPDVKWWLDIQLPEIEQ